VAKFTPGKGPEKVTEGAIKGESFFLGERKMVEKESK